MANLDCAFCGKPYTTRWNLDLHHQICPERKGNPIPEDKKGLPCQYCEKIFAGERRLREHEEKKCLKRPGQEPPVCRICKQPLNSRSGLLAHEKVCEKKSKKGLLGAKKVKVSGRKDGKGQGQGQGQPGGPHIGPAQGMGQMMGPGNQQRGASPGRPPPAQFAAPGPHPGFQAQRANRPPPGSYQQQDFPQNQPLRVNTPLQPQYPPGQSALPTFQNPRPSSPRPPPPNVNNQPPRNRTFTPDPNTNDRSLTARAERPRETLHPSPNIPEQNTSNTSGRPPNTSNTSRRPPKDDDDRSLLSRFTWNEKHPPR